jgi:hypothetical protein
MSCAKPTDHQICNTCNKAKFLSEFYKAKNNENGYALKCKTCNKNKIKCPNRKCIKCHEIKPTERFNGCSSICYNCIKPKRKKKNIPIPNGHVCCHFCRVDRNSNEINHMLNMKEGVCYSCQFDWRYNS